MKLFLCGVPPTRTETPFYRLLAIFKTAALPIRLSTPKNSILNITKFLRFYLCKLFFIFLKIYKVLLKTFGNFNSDFLITLRYEPLSNLYIKYNK